MRTHYDFYPNERDSIVKRFGLAFFEKAIGDLDTYAERWELSASRLIPSYSANLVWTCESERYGRCVLKIGNPASKEMAAEYNALREYDGKGMCSVFAADLANSVLLQERVQPGTPLRDEPSLEARLSVFSSIQQGLHIPPANASLYPTYADWVARITAYMSKREDCAALYIYMNKANDICRSLASTYTRVMLLHGDLHHDNMLRRQDGSYAIIDPKGVIGDPIFDIPRFILNEFEEELNEQLYRKINRVIDTLGQSLDIPQTVIRQCLFIETAMGNCWMVEDGATPEACRQLLANVAFADAILQDI